MDRLLWGTEGKLRPAKNMLIRVSMREAEFTRYLADLCHEWTSEEHPNVRQVISDGGAEP